MKSTKKQQSRVLSTASSKQALKTESSLRRSTVSSKQIRVVIWPEWSDVDINNEKWEGQVKTKEKDKSRTSCHYFEDPEKNNIPELLKQNVISWNKPGEYMAKPPVVVDPTSYYDFDLTLNNDHIYQFEIIRHIICEISFLWTISHVRNATNIDPAYQCYVLPDNSFHNWRPWEHIYSINKVTRGPNICQFNQYGKYCIKLFWMGCWRKITVDDYIPLDRNNLPLLVSSSNSNELWPLLLTKGLFKIAILDMKDGKIGDFSAIQCLTGWLPESIPMLNAEYETIWDLLKRSLKVFKWETEEPKEDPQEICSNQVDTPVEPKESSIKSKKKDDKKKDKIATKRESPMEEDVFSELPGVIVTAQYKHPNYPFNMIDLQQMTDVSIKMRKIGFSQSNPHPVLLQQIRDIPQFPPPVEPPVPAWKLIRPRKKMSLSSSGSTVECKFIKLLTPYFNFRISSSKKVECQNLNGSVLEDDKASVDDKAKTDKLSIQSEKSESDVMSPRKVKQNLTLKLPKGRRISSADSSKGESKQKRNSGEENKAGAVKKIKLKETDEVSVTQEDVYKHSLNSMSLDFADFYQCFRYLHLYHRPQAYMCCNKHTFIRVQQQTTTKDKKSLLTQILLPDENSPLFVLIDSNEQMELLISLTAFTLNEGSSQQSYTPISEHESESNIEECEKRAATDCHAQLVVESYSWRNIESANPPLLTLRTAGTKSEMLILPKGRHVLRCMSTSTYGYHTYFLSNTQFYLLDEDALMGKLGKESTSYVENAANFVKTFNSCLNSWHDQSALRKEWSSFNKLHCPYSSFTGATLDGYFDTFYAILLSEISSTIGEANMDSIRHALRALILDFSLKYSHKTTTGSANSVSSEQKTTGKTSKKSTKNDKQFDKPIKRASRQSQQIWSPESLISVVKLQSYFRGYLVRQAVKSRNSDHPKFEEYRRKLSELSIPLENQAERIGLNIFRGLSSEFPNLSRFFPFNAGEWTQVAFCDYAGIFAEQPAFSWFLLFRGIFHVSKEILVVPKLYSAFQNCRLRVIDNDTGNEISRVFDKISPAIYKPNKRGYTILAEGFTKDNPVSGGKWKLRLIGDHSKLPTSEKNDINHSFYVREITDYYVPLESSIFADYHVRVFEEHLTTIYVESSHSEIPVLLEIWDKDEVISFAKGIGSAVLPVVIFLKNGEEKHNYSIKVSALNYDWPMTLAEEEFVESLKHLDSNELNIYMKNEATTQSIEKTVDKGKKKDRLKTDCSHDFFDKTKPHWVLKIVSSGHRQEDIEVVRSISRNEELLVIKKAWEEAQPGRYIKAVNTRLEYYKENNLYPESEESVDKILQMCIKQAKDEIKEIDVSLYEKNLIEDPLMLTDELIEELIREKENNLTKFNEWYEEIARSRQKERSDRDSEKANQISELREMQGKVDKIHNENEKEIFLLRQRKLETRSPTPDSVSSKRKGSKKSLVKSRPQKK